MTIIKSTLGKSQSPDYNVINTHDGAYEERRYNSSVCISTNAIVDPADSDQGAPTKKDENEPCCKLFSYIQGQNEGNHNMEMCFPVIDEYTPAHGSKGEVKRNLSFFVPKEFEEKTPLPSDPDVSINQRPAMTVYAMKFGGYAGDDKCLKEKERFMSILEADGIKVKNDTFFCAFYNTPLKLFNRRNEIWFIKDLDEISEQPSLKLDVERDQ